MIQPVHEVVDFLRFSPDDSPTPARITRFSLRQWDRVQQWLDDHGLSFYFLQKATETGANLAIPPRIFERLQTNFAANQNRMDDLWRRFDAINHRFETAGIRYAAIKGFSLVPEFCPVAAMRHQSDLDYLVDEASLADAARVLTEAGYRAKPQISDQEITFLLPGAGKASRRRDQYSAESPHAIELHLDVWDADLNRLPAIPRQFSLNRAIIREWHGSKFSVLDDADAFVLQVLHTCRHLLTYWVRLSCLYEIAHFLHRRAADDSLWDEIAQRVGDNRLLRELTVVAAELSGKLFVPAQPNLLRHWGSNVRPATRVWIEHYARTFALGKLPIYELSAWPPAKLVLFLHQQYQSDCEQSNVLRRQLIAPSRLARLASAIKQNPRLWLDLAWWKKQRLLRRSAFHAFAGLRYMCEIPRWRWRTRSAMRPSAAGARLAAE